MSTIDYAAMQREMPKLKAALTRAKHSGDPQQVINVVDRAFARFDEIGWPDNWHTFNIAREDARLELARSQWKNRW